LAFKAGRDLLDLFSLGILRLVLDVLLLTLLSEVLTILLPLLSCNRSRGLFLLPIFNIRI